MELGSKKEHFIITELPAAESGPDPIYKGVFYSGTWYLKLPTADQLANGPISMGFLPVGYKRTGDSGFTGGTLASRLGSGFVPCLCNTVPQLIQPRHSRRLFRMRPPHTPIYCSTMYLPVESSFLDIALALS